MSGGANVTVTIGAAFAGSFKSVLQEADRDLKSFGKRTARSMRTADRAAAGLGKSMVAVGKAATGAHTAIGATARELHSLQGGAAHTAAAAREMRTLTTESRRAVRATNAVTAATVKGAKAQAEARKAMNPVALEPGATASIASSSRRPEDRHRDALTAAADRPAHQAQRVASRLERPPVTAHLARSISVPDRSTNAVERPRSVIPKAELAPEPSPSIREAMPRGYVKAVRETTRASQTVGRAARLLADHPANTDTATVLSRMPPAISRAVAKSVVPGVLSGRAARPPQAANAAAPAPSARRTASGIPAIRPGSTVTQPWGAPAAPATRSPRGGGRRPPGALAGYGGGTGGGAGGMRGGAGGGGHGVHSHDGAAIGGAVAGAFSAHTIWDAVKGAGEINDLQVLMKLQGRTSSEIAEATARAYTIARDNPAISSREALQSIIDTADVGDRDMKKAGRLAPLLARSAKAVALIGDEETKGKLGDGQGRALGRVMEDLGYGTKSEGEIKDLVDSVTQGVIATRGIYNPKELLQTVQKSGGMARGWNKEFIGQILPAVTMAMGGSGAGDALYMYQKALTKGQTGLGSAKALQALGLINKKDMQFDGKKFLGINLDSMPDPELLRQNPYEHFKKNIVPAVMKKAGISDVHAEREKFNADHGNDRDLIGLSDDDKTARLSDKFKVYLDDLLQKQVDFFAKAKNQSKMIADFIAQQEQIEAQIGQMKKQPKNALDILMGENFGAQIEAVTKSFHTLMSALGAPEVGSAISAMDSLSKGMAGLASAATVDPDTTKKVMAALAGVTAGIATLGTVALSGPVISALAAGGPVTLALGAVAAGLATWAALDWDGFTEGMTTLLNAAKMVGSIVSYLDGLGKDGDGNNLMGKAVSAMLGNRPEENDETTRTKKADALDAAKKRLAGYEPKARGAFPGQKAGLEDDVARAEADLKTTDDRIIAFEARRKKREDAKAKSAKALSDAEQAAKDLSDRQNAAKVLDAHTAHSDAASQEALDRFEPKAQDATTRQRRPGIGDAFTEGRKPVSAENVAPIPGAAVKPVAPKVSGPVPGTQGAPAMPGAAVASAGGRTVVDLAGPVSIKDDVGVKQPLRLVTPVLISAQGILAVHDSATAAAMSGLTGQISAMVGSLGGILVATQATAASCAAIAAKDFSPKITVQGGGGTTGAAKERSSFSD